MNECREWFAVDSDHQMSDAKNEYVYVDLEIDKYRVN